MRCIHAKKSVRHSLHSLRTPLVHILECTPCMSCQICPLPSIQIWVPGTTSGSSSTVWRVREQRSMALRWRKGSSTGAKKEPEHLNAAAYQPPPLAARGPPPRPLPPGNCAGQICRRQLEELTRRRGPASRAQLGDSLRVVAARPRAQCCKACRACVPSSRGTTSAGL